MNKQRKQIPEIIIVIPGIPFKTNYGGLGYCTISLIKDGGDVVLFDTGHYAVREKIIAIKKEFKINKVFLSHLHYDHCLNIDLFLKLEIKIYLHQKEYQYLNKIKKNDIYTFRYFNKIVNKNDLILFQKDFKLTKNTKVIETIGHTAGHSSIVINQNNEQVLIAGDAIKTLKDYKDLKKTDVEPYDYQKYIKNKKYLKNKFDKIIPGHSGIIKSGVHRVEKPGLYEF